MRIVFFGTSPFAAHVLAHLIKNPELEIVAVVTRPDRPQGRAKRVGPSAVKEEAMRLSASLTLLQREKASTDEFAATLKHFAPDLFIVVAYGEIIKQNLLSLPRLGCINVHASLLPKYRGAAPIQRAIMAGEKETGITIIEMVLALDAGPMLEKVVVPIGDNTTFGELEEKLIEAACLALDKTIRAFKENRVVKVLQDDAQATYAPKLTSDEEKIDWILPAQVLHNRIRALSPRPGVWCTIEIGDEKKRLKVKRTVVQADLSGEPGKMIVRNKDSLIVACGQGALQLLEVQLEGKKTLAIADFLRGYTHASLTIL